VQSDLLSVGMRIRKAVPEGYKTHKTSLFYDPTPALSTPTSTYQSRPLGRTELLPFCGLHKVGGHSVQEMPVDAQGILDIFSDETIPITSSQESNASTLSTDSMPAAPLLNPMIKNKRRFYEDEGDDEDIPPFQLHFSDPLNPLLADLSVSSPNMPFGQTQMSRLNAISARVMAKPRSRRKASGGVAMSEEVMESMDFEEADFLKPCEDEVDMGGM